MKIENVEMGVIKWERVWNDDREKNGEREREREREKLMILVTTANQIVEESKVVFIAKLFFFRNNEIKNYFCVMSWTSYKFEWLGTLIFCFE